jgi:hypothetical protein
MNSGEFKLSSHEPNSLQMSAIAWYRVVVPQFWHTCSGSSKSFVYTFPPASRQPYKTHQRWVFVSKFKKVRVSVRQ